MPTDPDPILDQMPALRRYALALTRNPTDADDLVQEALLRGHQNRRGFRPGGNLRAWLFSILRNAFLDRNRARQAEARREAAVAMITPQAIEAPQDAQVRLTQLRAAFLTLPQDQREALSLVAVEGLTYAEAAQLAGVPLGTLMSRVARARANLRAFEDGHEANGDSGGPDGPARAAPTLKLVGGRDANGD